MINKLDDLYVMNRIGRSGIKKDPMTILKEITDFSQRDEEGRSFLHIAVSNLDVSAAVYLLNKGVEADTDRVGNSLLHALAKSPFLNQKTDIIAHEEALYTMTKLVLAEKVKPKRKNDYEEISYVLAAQRLAYPILKALAENELKMDAPMENGMNLLHYILEKSTYNPISDTDRLCLEGCVEALLNSGLDAEDKDAFGNTPEYYAKKSDLRTVLALLQGNEGGKDEELMSLVDALTVKDFEVAFRILEGGYDVNEIDEKTKMTPLMWFCFTLDKDAILYLVNRRININYIDGATGRSALSLLISRGYYNLRGKPLNVITDILKILYKGNVEVNTVIDDHGNTALNLMCKQPDFEGFNSKIVEVLIDQEVDCNFPDLEGLSPMMSFARYNGKELELNIIESLIDEDAEVTQRDKLGNTVLSYAAMNTNDNNAKKIAELVLNVDSSLVSIPNNQGKTPLDIAIECGNEACAKLILMNM